jgi:hypothetical protein
MCGEFCNLSVRTTGIENVFIQIYSIFGNTHTPRIKVSNVYGKFDSTDHFYIGLRKYKVIIGWPKISQEELNLVRKWAKINRAALLRYWKDGHEIPTSEFLDTLKPINS